MNQGFKMLSIRGSRDEVIEVWEGMSLRQAYLNRHQSPEFLH